VVVGYGNHRAREVHLAAAAAAGVPVLRRSSGGGTVLLGAGCLAYSLVLPLEWHPELATVTRTNRFIMDRLRTALQPAVSGTLAVEGHTDLTLDGRKFSGNAQRRRSGSVLFHGTMLLSMDLEIVTRLLPPPSVEPAYRAGRPHPDFLINLQLPAHQVKTLLRQAWEAGEEWRLPIEQAVGDWVRTRYGTVEWHARR
jgi:lipoate-protein ligase A